MTEAIVTLENQPLIEYYSRLAPLTGGHIPGSDWEPLPLPDRLPPEMEKLLGLARMRWLEAPGDAPFQSVLDLRSDPETQTTKSFPSLLMIARAINHIRSTGERITILTPSSANKATALRRAVLAAFELKLVDPLKLSIVSVVPEAAEAKLRRSALCTDPILRELNPLLVVPGQAPEVVKPLVAEAARRLAASDSLLPNGDKLWLTLRLDNYTAADAARALFEADASPATSERLHAHSVSSAYGLLGYARGRELLRKEDALDESVRPGYLLVQHLYTSDMVQHLLGSSPPAYVNEKSEKIYRQSSNSHWPAEVDDPGENLDTTFYTHNPPTSPALALLIKEGFGTGMVVSRRECMAEYPMARRTFNSMGFQLPADPADLREWASVMCWTGLALARRRGLIPRSVNAVLHASGTYAEGDYETVPLAERQEVTEAQQIVAAVRQVSKKRGLLP